MAVRSPIPPITPKNLPSHLWGAAVYPERCADGLTPLSHRNT